MVYEDSGEIDSLLSPALKAAPQIEVTDEYGVVNRVWQVSDSDVIDSVRGKMRDKKVIIADGHHRYETAINYRNERRAQARAPDTSAWYEYAMMTFVNMNSSGLLILPTHRVVHGLSSFSPDAFVAASRDLFEVQELDPAVNAVQATAILRDARVTATAGAHDGRRPTRLRAVRRRQDRRVRHQDRAAPGIPNHTVFCAL